MAAPKNLEILRILLLQSGEDIKATFEVFSDIEGEHDISPVESLDDCLKIISERPFDLILLDIGMPPEKELDTFIKFMEALQETTHNAKTPVIVISSEKNYVVIQQILKAGAKDYLIKGEFGPKELNKIIDFATFTKRHLPTRKTGFRKFVQTILG